MAKSRKKPKKIAKPKFSTARSVAKFFGVTYQAFSQWQQDVSFPKKSGDRWDVKKIDAWLRVNRLGPHGRRKAVGEVDGDPITLAQARINELVSKNERNEIAIQKETIELEISKGSILILEDVRESHRRIAATAITLLDQLPDLVDRELPEIFPDGAAWFDIRTRIVAATKRIGLDVISQIREFLNSAADDRGSGFAEPA